MYPQTLPPPESPPQVLDVPTSAELTKFWKAAGDFFIGKTGPANRTEFLKFCTVNGWPVCTDDDWHKTNYALTALTPPQLRLLTKIVPEWATRQGKMKKDFPHGYSLDRAPQTPEPVKSAAYLKARETEHANGQAVLNSPEHQARVERQKESYQLASFRAARPDPNHSFPLIFHNGAPIMSDETTPDVTVTPVLPNVHQRIAAVYAGVGTIAATGRNEAQRYNFIPQSAITARLRELFAENGLIFEEHFLGFEAQTVKGQNKDGELVTVTMRYALVNADNPDERIVFETWPGRDTDFNGKGLQKAITNAKKTFLANQFLVSEYDDDAPPPADNGNANRERERDTRQQAQPPRNVPPSEPPPPEPPDDDLRPAKNANPAQHPRDNAVARFKALREAEGKVGLSKDKISQKEFDAMGIPELEKRIGTARSRLLAKIQELEAERYLKFGVPVTHKTDLWEFDDVEVARHAIALVS